MIEMRTFTISADPWLKQVEFLLGNKGNQTYHIVTTYIFNSRSRLFCFVLSNENGFYHSKITRATRIRATQLMTSRIFDENGL